MSWVRMPPRTSPWALLWTRHMLPALTALPAQHRQSMRSMAMLFLAGKSRRQQIRALLASFLAQPSKQLMLGSLSLQSQTRQVMHSFHHQMGWPPGSQMRQRS